MLLSKNIFFFQFKKFLTFLSKLTCGINQNNEIHKINEFIKNKELGKKVFQRIRVT